MPDKRDFLDGYVEVKDRIAAFYELFGQGRLVTDQVEILTAPDGKQRVMVRALAYRTPDDAHPAVGYSWMELPGTTNYTRGSELENTETSAIGRAIGFLGILVDKSIASANEIRAKAGEEAPERAHDGLIGTAIKQDKVTTDFHVRQSPDGPFLGFRLKNGDGAGVICEVRGPLADALAAIESEVLGKRVQVWGAFVQYEPPAVKFAYRAFRVTRIQTPSFILPANPTTEAAVGSSGASEPQSPSDPEIDALPMFDTAA